MSYFPASLPENSLLRRRRWTRWVGRSWARLSYGRHIEPTWLELTQHEVSIRGLHPAYEGFRVVHLSDFHGSKRVPLSFLRESVELANSQSPDVIALTGDFIHKGFRHIDDVASILGKLSAPHGVFAVLGNHDFSVRNSLGIRRHRRLHHAIAMALERHGVHVLRNRAHRLEHAGGHLHLVGVDDLWSRACDLTSAFAHLPETGPRLLLAHNPMTVERLGPRRCDLMLSGHTHGGQVNWPGVGRFFLGKHGRRYAAGWYQYRDSHLYVHRGVGYGFRFRFGVRPEVALLRLRQAARTDS